MKKFALVATSSMNPIPSIVATRLVHHLSTMLVPHPLISNQRRVVGSEPCTMPAKKSLRLPHHTATNPEAGAPMLRPFQCCRMSRDTTVRDTMILERSRYTTIRNHITSITNNRLTMRGLTMVRLRVSKKGCFWQRPRTEIHCRIDNATCGQRWLKSLPPQQRTSPLATRRAHKNWWLDRSGFGACTVAIYDHVIAQKELFVTHRQSAESTRQ